MAKTNQSKDDCSQQKGEIWTLQQVNVMVPLLLQILAPIENYRYSRI